MGAMNKRQFFRVEFDDKPVELPCRWAICRVGERKVQELYVEGIVLDLSAGGVRMQTELDLPIRQGIELVVCFQLEGEEFRFMANILRKIDTRSNYEYACEWVDISEDERQKLLQILNRLVLSRRGSVAGSHKK
jgi:hypothetical protein